MPQRSAHPEGHNRTLSNGEGTNREATHRHVYEGDHSIASALRNNPMLKQQITRSGRKRIFGASQMMRCSKTDPPEARPEKEQRDHEAHAFCRSRRPEPCCVHSGYAGDGEGPAANTLFTNLPSVVAQADLPNTKAYAQNRQVQTQAENGQGVRIYVSRSNHGTWLFQASPNQGAHS
jgi:hypothetical protein